MQRLVLLITFLTVGSLSAEGPLAFHLHFEAKAHPRPFSGRVYVLLSKNTQSALMSGPNWFRPEPFFAMDVKNVKPGQAMIVDRNAMGYPYSLDRLEKGTYAVQAVMDLEPNAKSFSTAPGNLYTLAGKMSLDPATTGPVELHLDRVFQAKPFVETARVKLVDIESKLLTAFHRRPTRLRAAIVLPDSYFRDPKKNYPAVYEIPGFGGDHFAALQQAGRGTTLKDGVEVAHIMLDPSCHHGHHVFADSANNGPCGKALIEELIPAIEARFRLISKPAARLLTGHSSGGWSSLWLQVTYPEFFGGCWSTAPDPVDFRDFQMVDIYLPEQNIFFFPSGEKRPLARKGKTPFLFYKPFSDMEDVMGHGGQLMSFEAVFGERGPDGQPLRLWDRKTGKINPEVARTWQKYDIRLLLERDWATKGPMLKGKLHVYMGDLDTFYLEGATRLLKESLAKLKSDAVVELFPGKDHGSLMTAELRRRMGKEMAASLRAANVVE